MKNQNWLRGLNHEQGEAVLHDEGPLLILAGAGSGKTTVLVSRTGRLIDEKKAKADNILVLTFTNKAARELKHRVHQKLGSAGQGLVAGTFHSFGLSLLKKHAELVGVHPRFSILDSGDAASLLKELMKEIHITGRDRYDVDVLLNLVNAIRAKQDLKEQAHDEYHDMAEILAPKFEKKMDLLGVVDFEGLLLKPLELLQKHPSIRDLVQKQFRFLMVDEFQDTNRLQMQLIHQLADGHQNIAVVGDDDQSIYGWRGAQVANILNFPREFKGCKTIKLERNYRSSANILRFANEVIAKNQNRHGKILRPEGVYGEGESPEIFVLENEDEEADFVVQELQRAKSLGFQWKEMAVLYRSNTQGGFIESALRKNRIEYSISGGTSIFDRKEAKDVMAYLRASLQGNEISFRRMMNVPARGVGDTTLEKLVEFAKQNRLSFSETARRVTQQWAGMGVQEKAAQGIASYQQLLQRLPGVLLEGAGTPGDRLQIFLKEIGYRQELMAVNHQVGAGDKRWQVVEIVCRILDSFLSKRLLNRQSLIDFIEAMTLRDDGEEIQVKDEVSLMTLHASKGLEFPFVILTGVEEDLLPHRSLGSDIDEERRLFYVGITRAKQKLVMSRCRMRKRHGAQRAVAPSRFILDLSPGLYQELQGAFRPVTGAEREDLVSGFLAKLQARPPQGKT